MISGVELGKTSPSVIEIMASSGTKGKIEIWLDELKTGKLIATIPVKSTKGNDDWITFSGAVKGISGHHDVFVKFPTGGEGAIKIKSIRFLK